MLCNNMLQKEWESDVSLFITLVQASVTTNTAAWLAQLGERRSAKGEVAGSNPGRTSTQGL